MHQHEWTENPHPLGTIDAWMCAECAETSATCAVERWDRGRGEMVSHPTGTASSLCDTCADRERYVLEDIRAALGHTLYAQGSGQLAAVRYDRVIVSGSGLNDAPRVTAGDIVVLLHQWADLWITGAASSGVTIPPGRDPLDTIRTGMVWAAHNRVPSQWDGYREGIRVIRSQARGVAGLRPRRENSPCPHCGGVVVRDWADRRWEPRPDGLSTTVRCTNRDCALSWDLAGWDRVKRHHLQVLPEVVPDQLITQDDARLVWKDIPRETVSSWIRRDEMLPDDERVLPVRGWDERGRPLYRVGDLAAMADRRADPARRGPKVV